MIDDFTVVLGIDRKTIEYLRWSWPTWAKHKSSLLLRRFVIFYDGVDPTEIDRITQLQRSTLVEWPPAGVHYYRSNEDKWSNPQRAKMLAGFVHVPPQYVRTPYWFKIDVDSLATGMDPWIQREWFDGYPSVIAPSWNYTKPPNQMMRLDDWAARHQPGIFSGTEPLNLAPEPGSDLVKHKRIASWCAFFSTEFSRVCSQIAEKSCGKCQLPVDSQDGFHFYCAQRAGFTIRYVPMKRYGWTNKSSLNSVISTSKEILGCVSA